MIREFRESDLPRLRELELEYEWTFGTDFLGALVYVDSDDKVTMVAGGWKVAEVHMLCDSTWKTPHARWLALQEMQHAMRTHLKRQGVRRALTFMDDMRAFGRKLLRLGWVKSESASFHHEV